MFKQMLRAWSLPRYRPVERKLVLGDRVRLKALDRWDRTRYFYQFGYLWHTPDGRVLPVKDQVALIECMKALEIQDAER